MKTIILFFVLLCSFNIYAQIHIDKQILNQTHKVYIILPDTVSACSKSFMSVYRKYWTLTKFEFITAAQKQYLKDEGNLFLGFSCFKRKDFNQQTKRVELIYMQVFFELYQYVKSSEKKGELDTKAIASFTMPLADYSFFDFLIKSDFYMGTSSDLDTLRYDMYGKVNLWGPGILKNYIQKINLGLTSKKAGVPGNHERSALVDDPKSLFKLKTETLVFPEYCIRVQTKKENGKKKGKEDVEDDEEEEEGSESKLLQQYTYSSELFSTEELNKKILESTEEFFYLVCVNDGPRKYIYIVSSKTGMIVYSDFSTPSYKFNKRDIKALMKTIDQG